MRKLLAIFFLLTSLSFAQVDSTKIVQLETQLKEVNQNFEQIYKILKNNEQIVLQNKAQLFDLLRYKDELEKAITEEKKKKK